MSSTGSPPLFFLHWLSFHCGHMWTAAGGRMRPKKLIPNEQLSPCDSRCWIINSSRDWSQGVAKGWLAGKGNHVKTLPKCLPNVTCMHQIFNPGCAAITSYFQQKIAESLQWNPDEVRWWACTITEQSGVAFVFFCFRPPLFLIQIQDEVCYYDKCRPPQKALKQTQQLTEPQIQQMLL